jgi:hypothetical protein
MTETKKHAEWHFVICNRVFGIRRSYRIAIAKRKKTFANIRNVLGDYDAAFWLGNEPCAEGMSSVCSGKLVPSEGSAALGVGMVLSHRTCDHVHGEAERGNGEPLRKACQGASTRGVPRRHRLPFERREASRPDANRERKGIRQFQGEGNEGSEFRPRPPVPDSPQGVPQRIPFVRQAAAGRHPRNPQDLLELEGRRPHQIGGRQSVEAIEAE